MSSPIIRVDKQLLPPPTLYSICPLWSVIDSQNFATSPNPTSIIVKIRSSAVNLTPFWGIQIIVRCARDRQAAVPPVYLLTTLWSCYLLAVTFASRPSSVHSRSQFKILQREPSGVIHKGRPHQGGGLPNAGATVNFYLLKAEICGDRGSGSKNCQILRTSVIYGPLLPWRPVLTICSKIVNQFSCWWMGL